MKKVMALLLASSSCLFPKDAIIFPPEPEIICCQGQRVEITKRPEPKKDIEQKTVVITAPNAASEAQWISLPAFAHKKVVINSSELLRIGLGVTSAILGGYLGAIECNTFYHIHCAEKPKLVLGQTNKKDAAQKVIAERLDAYGWNDKSRQEKQKFLSQQTHNTAQSDIKWQSSFTVPSSQSYQQNPLLFALSAVSIAHAVYTLYRTDWDNVIRITPY